MKKSDNRNTSFGYRFAMLHRLHMALCRKNILNQGLLPSQLPFIISLVHEDAPVTQNYLSNCLAIDKGTTARAIGQLEEKGYIKREINPKNRRQNLVCATPMAHANAKILVESLTRASNILVQDFTAEEKKNILNLMDRMLSNARNATNHK